MAGFLSSVGSNLLGGVVGELKGALSGALGSLLDELFPSNKQASDLEVTKLIKNAPTMSWAMQSLYVVNNFQLGMMGGYKVDFFEELKKRMKASDSTSGPTSLVGVAVSAVKKLFGFASGSSNSDTEEVSIEFDEDIRTKTFDSKVSTAMLAALFVESVNVSAYSAQLMQEWTGNTWQYGPGRPNLQTIDITFRDVESGVLWRFFNKYWVESMTAYPKELDSQIYITRMKLNNSKAEKTNIDPKADMTEHPVTFATNNARITQVTPPQFNSSNQISTFSVQFTFNPVLA